MTNPTSAGELSKTRLRRIDVMTGHVDDGSMPGPVSLVSRGEVFVDAIGKMALVPFCRQLPLK
jgi:hypothetical protein